MYTPSKKFGMVKSSKYRNWIEKNLPIVRENLDKAEFFPIDITIKVCGGRDFNDKNDIDNCIKSAIDLLVKAEILPDDSTKYIHEVSARYFHFSGGEVITIISYNESQKPFDKSEN